MMSPADKCGTNCSMKSSTAWPALTNIMIRRGVLSLDTNSAIE